MNWDSDREAGVAPAPVAAHIAPTGASYMNFASSDLKFLEKPFAKEPGSESISSSEGPSRRKSRVEFNKREAATAPELFYDLWFVANLTVFSSANPITEESTLYIFIAYFVLLWTTWFVTSVYIVRFGQDGILARMGFACHLGSLVGFTLLGISFGKENLLPTIMRITCITMAFSRLLLATQYGLVLFQARNYSKTRIPVLITVLIHFVPGLLYLIIGLTIKSSTPTGLNGYVFVIWCTVAVLELVTVLGQSALSETLSFEGTHMRERFNVLTLIVLGEGASILTKNITVIVEFTYLKNIVPYWSSALIGTVFCATSILYLSFALYFDWMHQHNHMKRVPQAIWSFLHLPFHCVLILLAEGTGQWGIIWRANEALTEIGNTFTNSLQTAAQSQNMTTVANALQNTTLTIMNLYGVDSTADQKVISDAIDKFKGLPNTILEGGMNATEEATFNNATNTVGFLLERVVYKSFSISVGKTKTQVAQIQNSDVRASVEAMARSLLVLSYLFIAAGLVLIFLMILHLISKRKGWTIFNIARTSAVVTIGVGLCLVALINTNETGLDNFTQTPWQLPIIVICFFTVLVLTHMPTPQEIMEKFRR
ncbi:unnamed protein product [Clonostachys rosea f. rosea IK726]|uniref:Uncharacterized protein n=2 Tax=Bionectria ochroleuca TaxID=29856 RepID=A0A0B7K3U0_BIOOC|nr:unnamed protein product [Clonostachys rosea f. rosea IK726]